MSAKYCASCLSRLFSFNMVWVILVGLNLPGVTLAASPGAPARQTSALTLAAISPRYGLNNAGVTVTITGTGFEMGITARLEPGSVALQNIARVDSTTLQADIPAWTPSGIYSLQVNNPSSNTASLVDAYTVLDPPPADLLTDTFQVAAGSYNTCALTGAGGVLCWGKNEAGQVGDGTTTNRAVPTPVIDLAGGVKAITVGGLHACALLDSGGVRCWGWNPSGQLGDGTTTDRLTPVSVPGLVNVTAIAAGRDHTCALLAGGTVQCWGANFSGQLGDGTTTDRSTPVSVSGLANVTAIAAGGYHTCALLGNGSAQCWGYNFHGQLGDGTTTDRAIPVGVSGLVNATSIATGGYHTCALLDNGSMQCWGSNSSGQLGDGTITNRSTPVSTLGLVNVTGIAAGAFHTCALLDNGSAQCWGSNSSGQLGDGAGLDSDAR